MVFSTQAKFRKFLKTTFNRKTLGTWSLCGVICASTGHPHVYALLDHVLLIHPTNPAAHILLMLSHPARFLHPLLPFPFSLCLPFLLDSTGDSVNEYRENPIEEEEEEGEEEEKHGAEEEDKEAAPATSKTAQAAKKAEEEQSEDEDSYWESSSSEEESDEEDMRDRNEQRGFRGWIAADFLKVNTQAKQKKRAEAKPAETKAQKDKSSKEAEAKPDEDEEGEEKELKLIGQVKRREEKTIFQKGEDITLKNVMDKFKEVRQVDNYERGR